MKRFCGVSFTVAARIIGVLDLSTAVLAINFLAEEFASDSKRVFVFDEIRIFLGLNWARPSGNCRSHEPEYTWVLFCLLFYSMVHLMCTATLVLATIFKTKSQALPWLTFEIINLANQGGSIFVHIVQDKCEDTMLGNHYTCLPLASFYLILGVFSWSIVFAAQKSWPSESTGIVLGSTQNSLIELHSANYNLPKSPSALANNRSIFESPQPPIPSKYYEV
ncbi:uncharacterized protein LOC105693529 [Athalia rosae]|uniref:uncharacterized protein LOC105693529 n=1 Tax=Athalia rosae TaxID=37344 RepID=UPI00203327B8|nr:uncharacterized protein LOC105693529 [Athalia rosae]